MQNELNEKVDDGWRDPKDMPDDLHVLFIEGCWSRPVSWMANKYQTYKSFDGNPRFAHMSIFRVFCDDPAYLCDEDIPPDAFGIERCHQEIQSGRYHAIVAMDYSSPEYNNPFGIDLDIELQTFVAAGGVVAFPCTESEIVPTLEELFDVEWTRGSYYRSNWGPCLDVNERNIHYSFGNGNYSRRVIKDYSVKANTIKHVPYHERCFGLTARSKRSWGEAIPADGENFEAIVAMHEYGKGVIAYFGDVNAEHQTIELVAAFVESRAPRHPIDCSSGLDESVFIAILLLKEEGNGYFKEGKIDEAIASYKYALEMFGHKASTRGPKRDCQVALWSNLTLMYMKKEDFHQAESSALKALDLEWGHAKCSYNLAKARLNISRKTRGGDLVRLRHAKRDVINAERGNATRKLLCSITDDIEKLEKKEQKRFSASFASGFASAVSD